MEPSGLSKRSEGLLELAEESYRLAGISDPVDVISGISPPVFEANKSRLSPSRGVALSNVLDRDMMYGSVNLEEILKAELAGEHFKYKEGKIDLRHGRNTGEILIAGTVQLFFIIFQTLSSSCSPIPMSSTRSLRILSSPRSSIPMSNMTSVVLLTNT